MAGELLVQEATTSVGVVNTFTMGVPPDRGPATMLVNMGPKDLDELVADGTLTPLGSGMWCPEELAIVLTPVGCGTIEP